MKRLLALNLIVVTAVVLVSCMTPEQRQMYEQRIAQNEAELATVEAERDRLATDVAGIEAALDGAPPEAAGMLQQQIRDLNRRVNLLGTRTGQLKNQIEADKAELKGPDTLAAVGEGAATAGTIAAPFTGPWGWAVLLGTNVLNTVASWVSGKRTGVKRVVQPLEAARVRGEEIDGSRIVIDKNAVSMAHLASGVAGLIKKFT
jgi:outer membrane murein-binding lipoprotein Lpp